MVKPSPILYKRLTARLQLTTKQVNKGYYKGNRTGSMGAHTQFGNYVIDWRKVRHYNCPDLTNCKLTPFVTKEKEATKDPPKKMTAREYLELWYDRNPQEYHDLEQASGS